MKKPVQRLIITAVLAAIMAGIASWYVLDRERQRHWHGNQMRRCAALANLLYQYEQKKGYYPESLRDLEINGLISPSDYQNLMFQESPQAASKEWQYYRPSSLTGIALLSKQPIYPWKGSSGIYIIGRPDGSVESFSDAKLAHYMKTIQAEAADGKTPESLQPPR